MAIIKSPIDSDIYHIVDMIDTVTDQYIDEADNTKAVGIFGYLNAMMAVTTQNAVHLVSETANEVFPNRAKYARNLYTHAMQYDVDNIFAVPASIQVLIGIKESDFLKYAVSDTFVIDKECTFYIGSHEFHPYYDVIVSKKNKLDGGFVYTARYDNSYNNPMSKITDPYLDTPAVQAFSNVNYVYVPCLLSQVTRTKISKKIINSSLIDNKTFIFDFKGLGQLACFTIKVTQNGVTTELTPVYDGCTPDVGVEYFCYYLLVDDYKVRVKFERTSFTPSVNAEIVVDIQTTEGKSGIFEYTDTRVSNNISSSTYGYNNISTFEILVGDSKDGVDSKDADTLHTIIPREALARGAITTTADLTSYFNQLNTDTDKILIHKKVDNQKERTHYAHLLLTDSDGNIVPTNTITLDIRMTDFPIVDNDRYVLPAGAIIEFDISKGKGNIIYLGIDGNDSNANATSDYAITTTSDTSTEPVYDTTLLQDTSTGDTVKITNPTYKTVGSTTDIVKVYDASVDKFIYRVTDDGSFVIDQEDVTKFYYITPFTIIVNASNELYSAYYLCIINENLALNFKYINQKADVQFIGSTVRWYRKFISDRDTYKLDFVFTQNILEDMGLIAYEMVDGVKTLKFNKVRVVMVLYRDSNAIAYKEAEFVQFDGTAYKFTYQFKFKTNDIMLDTSNNIRIEDVGIARQSITSYSYFEANTKANIYILYETSDDTAGRYDLDSIVPGYEGYIVSNMFEIINGIDFFINYSGVTASKIDVEDHGSNEDQSFLLTGLPCLGYQYSLREDLVDEFIDSMNLKKAYIDGANKTLENSFSVDFKFFNSYGPSKLYTVDEEGTKFLDRTNVQLHFDLKLKSAYDVNTTDYILQYIKDYIEDLNGVMSSIHMTKLLALIYDKYGTSIDYIDFTGIDNYGFSVQHIYKQDLDYVNMVPEFINVNNIIDVTDGSKTPDIIINIIS